MQTGARSAHRILRDATEKLRDAGIPEPEASAAVLLSELLGVRRSELAFHQESLTEEQVAIYEAWISRRLHREPVQRILGYAYFRNLRLDLDEHAFIPRSDTETVVDAVLQAVDRLGSSCRVLEIGTGSGAIAISVAQERPYCEVHATEVSEGAIEVARRNAERAGVNVCFHRTDLVFGLEVLARSVDVLVSNPPYIKSEDVPKLAPEVREWEPIPALGGGSDGLDFFRRIFIEATPLLTDDADLVLEVGDGQAEEVLELGRRCGYAPLGTRADLTGRLRAALLRRDSP